MIRRHTAPAHYHLITQTNHALLSARLARHLGNTHFSPPDAPTLLAIAHHDDGWPLHDDSPTLNDQHLPRDVFESTPAIAFPIWTASADRAQALDPYAGLLVSLHGLALSTRLPIATPKDLFSLNQFQHHEFERHEHLRKQLHLRTDLPLTHGLLPQSPRIAIRGSPSPDPREDLLRFHLRLLQAMDLLSLSICCTHPPAPATQDLHPHPASPPLKLTLTRPAPDRLVVDPWPFNQPRLALNIAARRLPARPYSSPEEFQAAYIHAPKEILSLTVEALPSSS